MANRKRSTSAAVYFWDRASRAGITVGGIAILAAVLGICLYLFAQVFPLFEGGSATRVEQRPTGLIPSGEPVRMPAPRTPSNPRVAAVVGEYNQALATLGRTGRVEATELATGTVFHDAAVFEGNRTITAASLTAHGPAALALSDGSLLLGTLKLESSLMSTEDLTPRQRDLAVGASVIEGPTLIERTRETQWRSTTLHAALKEAQAGGGQSPIVQLDLRDSGSDRYLALVRQDGTASLGTITTVTPLGGDEPVETVSASDFQLTPSTYSVVGPPDPPDYVFVTADGRNVLAIWKSGGVLQRYAPHPTKDGEFIMRAEETRVLPPIHIPHEPQAGNVTAATMLLGGQTLLIGDDHGDVRAYHVARDPTSPAFDAMRLVESDAFSVGEGAVVSLAASPHDRLAAAATDTGNVVVRHMTSHKNVATFSTGEPPTLVFSPKGDAVAALTATASTLWALNPGHADASLSALFGPVLYEGELEPQYIYQSSSGGEGAQVKLSLIPLIFGTLKATIVAMLIAIPLAVLAAIYTSEFMNKDLRKVVKPTIELMASLPSVVLGFIAAMVVAPFMAEWLPQVLLSITLTPVFLGLFAHLWQLVPRNRAHRINRRARMALIATALLGATLLSLSLARPVEKLLFAPTRTDQLLVQGSVEAVDWKQWPAWVGQRTTLSPTDQRRLRQDGLMFRAGSVVRVVEAPVTNPAVAGEPSVRRWLDGSIGGPFPGWLLAIFLPVLVAVFLIQARAIPRERFEAFLGTSGPALAMAELIRYFITLVAGVGLAAAIAYLLTTIGLDPRDSIFGPYSQRNSLVVGVIMGFAVIPIIYTISEDALRAVPNHLRSASLGVGATPWQTAVRVVLPTAASGIFSAIMIGLGRAVGETMIVLMATGNTPEISSNIFSGLRTLAANIAVELPEAVRGDTHYRVLFLCGLVLFVMTFAINTTAEIVRQRFRKRNAAL